MPDSTGNAGAVGISPRRLGDEALVETTRWSVGRALFYGTCLLGPLLVVSSGAVAQSRHLFGSAGVVQACWVRSGVPVPWRSLHSGPQGPIGRDDVLVCGGVLCSIRRALLLGRASPACYKSCRAERSEVETSPRVCRTQPGMLGPWGSLHAASIGGEALVETTLVRRGVLCLGHGSPPPLFSRVERSGSAVETPPWA